MGNKQATRMTITMINTTIIAKRLVVGLASEKILIGVEMPG